MADDSPTSPDEPTLSDVLAALVTSVSRARVQADLASAEVARVYLQHDLLKMMPIPRLRLNKVHVSLPLVVTQVRKGEPYVVADPEVIAQRVTQDMISAIDTTKALTKEVDQVLADGEVIDPQSEAGIALDRLGKTLTDALETLMRSTTEAARFEFPAAYSRAFRAALQPHVDRSEARGQTSELELEQLCAKVVERVVTNRLDIRRGFLRKTPAKNVDFELEDYYPQIMGEQDQAKDEPSGPGGSYVRSLHQRLLVAMSELIATLGARAGRHALSKSSQPPQIDITVHTADVKNEGNPGTVTHVNMMMSEEGLEWVAESTDSGEPQWKLLPE